MLLGSLLPHPGHSLVAEAAGLALIFERLAEEVLHLEASEAHPRGSAANPLYHVRGPLAGRVPNDAPVGGHREMGLDRVLRD